MAPQFEDFLSFTLTFISELFDAGIDFVLWSPGHSPKQDYESIARWLARLPTFDEKNILDKEMRQAPNKALDLYKLYETFL